MKLSMILPIYQEEKRLPEGLSDLQSFLARLPLEMELLFVCEPGDSEFTRDSVVRTAKGPRPLTLATPGGVYEGNPIVVRILENQKHLGRGPSVQRGLNEATGDILIVLSADLNIPLAESFAAVQEFLRDPEGTGFILGNRRSLKRPRHGARPRIKKIFDDIEHDKAKGLEIPDPTSPFFAISKEWWQKAQPVKLRRWYYTPGLVHRLRELRAPIKSLDINSHDSPETRFRWYDSVFR